MDEAGFNKELEGATRLITGLHINQESSNQGLCQFDSTDDSRRSSSRRNHPFAQPSIDARHSVLPGFSNSLDGKPPLIIFPSIPDYKHFDPSIISLRGTVN